MALMDANRQRCPECAQARASLQRANYRSTPSGAARTRRSAHCARCGSYFRWWSTEDRTLCASCRRTDDWCPRCEAPLHGVRKYRWCDACFYVTNTEEVLAASGLEPLEPWPGAQQPWLMKCRNCGQQVSPTFSNMAQGKSQGCVYCAGRAVSAEELERVTSDQKIKPLEPWPGSASPWRCECLKCGATINVVWSSIYRGEHQACSYCSGIRIHAAEAEDLMRQVGLVEPLEPYVNAKKPWRSRCLRCGKTVRPTYNNVKSGLGACSACANYGFRNDDPAVVYLLHNAKHEVGKFGITNTTGVRGGTFRLNYFFNRGFNAALVYEFTSGEQARLVEAELLKWVRLDLQLAAPERRAFGNGSSEMFLMEGLSISRFKSRLTRIAKKHEGVLFERFQRQR